jgi:transposase
MATERLSMRKTREILRQKWEMRRSHREVAFSVCTSASTIADTVSRATMAGLDWAQVQLLSDEALEGRMYRGAPSPMGRERPMPDCAYLHTERRKVGVTLDLLHHEYLEQHPDGYRYTQFCEIYRRWTKQRRLTMRQAHRAGEKAFIDYSGKKPHYIDPKTGERIEAELFVAVLGVSNYTYAEATASQKGYDFIGSHVRALEYFCGAPEVLVPDQLKSGVTQACRYEPEIQHTYEEMAQHYGTTVIPARPKKPRDKAKVEAGVLIAQRWILARLRNQTFFSLDALNERIAELLEELNARTMKVYRVSRRELFEKLDAPALKPLPAERFVFGEWAHAGVNIDYHIEIEGHYYSCHYLLVGERVEARFTATTVEIFFDGKRHASHARSYERGRFTTKAEHRPKAHQDKWPPSRIISWAEDTVGPRTAELVRTVLQECRHPERGYRSCMGIMRLSKRYGSERLEAACARALLVKARSYRHVDSILKNGLDRLPLPSETTAMEERPPIEHENIRGRDEYR